MKKIHFIIFIVICLLFVIPKNEVRAVTADDVRQQIEDTNSQINDIDLQIKKYEEQISKTGQEKTSLSKLIRGLNYTRSKLLKEKKKTTKKIDAVSRVIEDINWNITTQEKSIKNSKKLLGKLIFDLYINDRDSIIEKILANESITSFSTEYNNIISINKKLDEHLEEVRIKKYSLATTKTQKENENGKLNNLKQNLSLQQQAVETTKKEKNRILIQTKNKESNYLKLLADERKKRDAFESSLLNYESQLKFILNPSLLPEPGSGVLSWPLDYILVTQFFGITSSSGRLYRSGSHSGMDFRASVGTPVRAMANGVVVDTGDTDLYCKRASFGKWVFIKYDNGLSSTYGHLSAVRSIKGQRVKTGDVVALSGNTGHSTAQHLHVSVYASQGVSVKKVPSLSCNGKSFIMPIASVNAYLDPALYFPKITKDMIK